MSSKRPCSGKVRSVSGGSGGWYSKSREDGTRTREGLQSSSSCGLQSNTKVQLTAVVIVPEKFVKEREYPARPDEWSAFVRTIEVGEEDVLGISVREDATGHVER